MPSIGGSARHGFPAIQLGINTFSKPLGLPGESRKYFAGDD